MYGITSTCITILVCIHVYTVGLELQVCKRLFILTGIRHKIASAYHPQCNGLVERYNQTIQRSLIKLVSEKQNNWDMFLDGVLFAYRTSVHKSTAVTPFELMFCR